MTSLECGQSDVRFGKKNHNTISAFPIILSFSYNGSVRLPMVSLLIPLPSLARARLFHLFHGFISGPRIWIYLLGSTSQCGIIHFCTSTYFSTTSKPPTALIVSQMNWNQFSIWFSICLCARSLRGQGKHSHRRAIEISNMNKRESNCFAEFLYVKAENLLFYFHFEHPL